MGLFFKIPSFPLPRPITSIFLGVSLSFISMHVSAANALANEAALPVGSHADANAQFSNARHLWQSGKLKQAAALYESLIKRYPDLPDPYNNLAVIYAAQGNYKKAQQILEKGLNTHPGYAAIYENLTAIYVEMARDSYGKALQFADQPQRQLKLRALAELSVKPVQIAKVETPVVTPPATTTAKVSIAAANAETPLPGNEPPVLSATTSVKPLNTAEAESATQAVVDQAAITATLESWASAWSAQSLEQYLAYYDQDFHPPGMSRRKWEAQRVDRIKRPQWIRVSLSNFSIQPITEQRVSVKVQQRYQSNTYSDSSRKEFILQETEQGWRIMSERNL